MARKGPGDRERPMSFHAMDVAEQIVGRLGTVFPGLAAKDRALEDEARRAAISVALNISEGRLRTGTDRLHAWRIAAGSCAELRTCLKIAVALRYLDAIELRQAFDLIDREMAMLWRLTRGRASVPRAAWWSDR